MTDIPKAIPFIIFDQKTQNFQITQEAIDFFENLNIDKMGVVTIVGKYRTGKSFFVNSVLLKNNQDQQQDGFAVGPTINPCTKGIWIWNKLQDAQDFGRQDSLPILVMDTEGFGGIDEDTNHDTRIFMFSILLSSYFIFNSQGTIDENALTSLSLILNLAREIKIKNDNQVDENEIKKNFPTFLWVIRDFMLGLTDENGIQLTQKEYLEKALKEQNGVTEQILQKNKIRRMIKHFFQDRDCLTMIRPSKNDEDLKILDQLEYKFMRPEFVKQIKIAQKKIYKKVKPKMIENNSINGSTFLEAAQCYVQAINSGSIPCIENAWSYIQKEEIQKNYKKSINLISQKLEELQQNNEIDKENWEKKIKEEIMEQFGKNSYGDQEMIKKMTKDLEQQIDEEFEKVKKIQTFEMEKTIKKQFEDKYFLLKQQMIQQELYDYNQAKEMLQNLQEELNTNKSQQKENILNKLIHQKQQEIFSLILNQKRKHEEKSEAEKKQQKRELEDLHGDYQSLQKQLERQKQQILDYENKISKLKDDNQELEQQLQKNKKLLKEKDEILQQQKLNFQQQINEQDSQTQKELQQKINHLEQNIQNQQLVDKQHTKEIELKEERIQLIRKELENYKDNNEKLKDELKLFKENDIEINKQEFLNMKHRIKELEKIEIQYKIKESSYEDQISLQRSNINEIKNLYEKVLQNFRPQSDQDNFNGELLQTNKNLTNLLSKSENKVKSLEEKVNYYKEYKIMVQMSKSMRCSKCSKDLAFGLFKQHIEHCDGEIQENIQQNNNLQNYFSIDKNQLSIIGDTYVRIDDYAINSSSKSNIFMEYIIQVFHFNKQWIIKKKYNQFCQLLENLREFYPHVKMPSSSMSLMIAYTNISSLKNMNQNFEQKKRNLERFLNEILKIEEIRKSNELIEFLNLPENSQNKSISKLKSEILQNYQDISDDDEDLNYHLNKFNNTVLPDNIKEKLKRRSQKRPQQIIILFKIFKYFLFFYQLQFQMKTISKIIFIFHFFIKSCLEEGFDTDGNIIVFDKYQKSLDSQDIDSEQENSQNKKKSKSIQESQQEKSQQEEQEVEENEEGEENQEEEENEEKQEEENDDESVKQSEEEFSVEFYNPDIIQIPSPLTYEFISGNITSYNSNTKNCFENHYKRTKEDQIPLEEIVEDCVGPKGIFLIEYYNDIKFLMKQYVKETLRTQFLEGICDDDVIACVYYMKNVNVFLENDLDIRKSIAANQDSLLTNMGLDKLQFFNAINLDLFRDYEILKQSLKENQDFLLHYVNLMRDQYLDEYVIVDEEDIDNEDEENQENGQEVENQDEDEEQNDDQSQESDEDKEDSNFQLSSGYPEPFSDGNYDEENKEENQLVFNKDFLQDFKKFLIFSNFELILLSN